MIAPFETCLSRVWLPAALLLAASLSIPARGAEDTISREDALKAMEVLTKLDPKKGDLKGRLQRAYPGNDPLRAEQIRQLIGPPRPNGEIASAPRDDDPNILGLGEIPATDAEAALRVMEETAAIVKKTKEENLVAVREKYRGASREELLATIAGGMPAQEDLIEALHKRAGIRQGYTALEIRNTRDYGTNPVPQKEPLRLPSPPQDIWSVFSFGVTHPLVRQSWTDVLAAEDPSSTATKDKLDDLVGATFSYTHDGNKGEDIWNANGAIIFPFTWGLPVHRGDWTPEAVTIAPSLTINQVTNGVDPKKDADEVLYRLGSYLSWQIFNGGADLRMAGVYATDRHHDAELPGYELDVIPRILWDEWPSGNTLLPKYLKLGYTNILIPKNPVLEDQSDNSALDYQLTAYLHLEGGDVQDNGGKWSVVEDDFVRHGTYGPNSNKHASCNLQQKPLLHSQVW